MILNSLNKMNEISVPVWWIHDGMLTRRDCLEYDHPEHTYNYIKREFGVEPELYGVLHPLHERYKDLTREQLMSKLAALESKLI